MTALQFSIGALNDLVDAPRDRGRRPVKAVAEGLLAPRTAMIIAAAASVAGLALAAPSGLLTLAVAAAGAACGYAYDLRLSRTAWAWLPLAVALPLVPVFAWTGATGGLPREFGVLVPIAMLAGAGLAIGNALADLDADAAAGAPSVVLRLGRRRAGGLHAAALGVAVALAVAGLPPGGPPTATWLALAGAIVLGLGMAALLSAGSGAGEARARLGWQVEAVGTALLGAAWAMAIAGAGAG